METYSSKATICVKDKFNIEYHISEIFYYLNEDETFKYVLKPNYSVISLTNADFFQGIPGLNLDLKKEEYIRENINPVFISERVPQKNREDYFELLDEVGLSFMDPLLYLIKTKKQYFGDNLYLIPYKEIEEVNFNNFNKKDNTSSFIKKIISNLAMGNDVSINGELINDTNRKLVFNVLLSIYSRSIDFRKEKQIVGINKGKLNNVYKGRKPINIDRLKFMEILDDIEKGKINAKEGAKKLNISIDKFYREKKKIAKIKWYAIAIKVKTSLPI